MSDAAPTVPGHPPAKIVGGRRVPEHKPHAHHSEEATIQTNVVANVLTSAAGNPAETAVINNGSPAPKHEPVAHEKPHHEPTHQRVQGNTKAQHNPRGDHNHLNQPGSRNQS